MFVCVCMCVCVCVHYVYIVSAARLSGSYCKIQVEIKLATFQLGPSQSSCKYTKFL